MTGWMYHNKAVLAICLTAIFSNLAVAKDDHGKGKNQSHAKPAGGGHQSGGHQAGKQNHGQQGGGHHQGGHQAGHHSAPRAGNPQPLAQPAADQHKHTHTGSTPPKGPPSGGTAAHHGGVHQGGNHQHGHKVNVPTAPVQVRPGPGPALGTHLTPNHNHHSNHGAMHGNQKPLVVNHHQNEPHHNNHHGGNTIAVGQHHIHLGNSGYRPTYARHASHYHGHWNGNWNNAPYAGYGWTNHHHHHSYRPYFWGLGGWGLGTLIYNSGYAGYYNPYYLAPTGTVVAYNYSQPIPVVYNASVPVDTGSVNGSSQVMDSAVAAFKQNQYEVALDLANQGIRQHPDDAVLHEFRGLVLFARGDYQQAASTVHSVLAVGPGWDWATLSGLYADLNLYTVQLRALEGFVKQNPQDGASRFLLAYHYMSDGYPDAAARQLQQVVALIPNDAVAASLLKMTTAPQTASLNDPSPVPIPQPPVDLPVPTLQSTVTPPVVDSASITGEWKATRQDGSRFGLTLTGEKTFRWSYQNGEQPEQSFDGTYTLEGNVLALERSGGGSLVAEITSNDGTKFNFKMVGSPAEDPGLNFVR